MNRDVSIITRALLLAGQEPLTDEDITENSTRYRAICASYLPVVLSVFSSAEWTELKRRERLYRLPDDVASYSTRACAFALPDDCARAIELTSLSDYEIEGRILYTDDAGATLVYITNGRRAKTDWRFGQKYGDAFVHFRHYDLQVKKTEWEATSLQEIRWVDVGDDYPEYITLDWSPELTECVTATLASELVLKITADKQLYSMLIQMAAASMDVASRLSRTKGASRTNAEEFWGDRLGIVRL